MRIPLCLLVIATALAVPQVSGGHGIERHYGNPFRKSAAAPPSPAFSMLLVDSSLQAIRRTLHGEEAEEDVDERLARIARSTAALVRTTADGSESAFQSFASTLETQSAVLLGAVRTSSRDEALEALQALEASFRASKRRFEAAEEGG